MTTALAIDQAPVVEAMTWPARAEALAILSADDYRQSAELLKAIKALRATIAETFGPHVKRAFDAHRALVAEQRAAEEPLTKAEAIIKGKLLTFEREQELLRREEESRLREIARQDEERRRLEEAAAMELEASATGDAELQAEAEAYLAQPVAAPVVTVAPMTPKVAGITYRETWSGEVTDALALVKHIAAHPEHLNLVTPNMTAINGLARSLRGSLSIPGVRAVSTRQIASGR